MELLINRLAGLALLTRLQDNTCNCLDLSCRTALSILLKIKVEIFVHNGNFIYNFVMTGIPFGVPKKDEDSPHWG